MRVSVGCDLMRIWVGSVWVCGGVFGASVCVCGVRVGICMGFAGVVRI